MLKKILLGLLVLVGLLVGVAYLLPREVHVERSTTIAAAPEAVYPHVSGMKAFHAWSPWSERDPEAKYTFEGPEAGVGSKMVWAGNEKVGQGSQVITEAKAPERVVTALDFGEQGGATATFTLAPDGEGTRVTWSLDADMGMNPIGRWMGLFFDSMVGTDYEEGLGRLKARVEKAGSAG